MPAKKYVRKTTNDEELKAIRIASLAKAREAKAAYRVKKTAEMEIFHEVYKPKRYKKELTQKQIDGYERGKKTRESKPHLTQKQMDGQKQAKNVKSLKKLMNQIELD
jgi:hypothetical protein